MLVTLYQEIRNLLRTMVRSEIWEAQLSLAKKTPLVLDVLLKDLLLKCIVPL
jgi:hypothetical protein